MVGIDEVGRGPIAGPVAVCAFICQDNFFDDIEIKTPLRDSKKLSAKQRGEWFEYLKLAQKDKKCDFSVSYVSAENIDKFGISKAIKKALETSLLKIVKDCKNLRVGVGAPEPEGRRGISEQDFYNPERFFIYLDGGLKAPEQFINQETIIKGDELHKVISCASIIAKVSRDRVMENFAKEYPEYGFENHVGYGTKAHYDAIKKRGTCPIHRKTFIH